MIRTTIFFLFFFACVALLAQETDSEQVVYDTVYTYDTIVQKKEVTVYEEQEYVLDLSVGFSGGRCRGFSAKKDDANITQEEAHGLVLGVPFRANFRPWFVATGVQLNLLATNTGLATSTWKTDSIQYTITDTLDSYYVVKQGKKYARHVLQSRDTTVMTRRLQRADTGVVNRYSLVEIPLMAGYQLDFKHVSVALSAGIHTMVVVGSRPGNLLSDGSAFVVEKSNMLRRCAVNPAIDAQLFVPLGESIDLACAFSYQYCELSVYKDVKYRPINQSFTTSFAFYYHF